MEDSICATATPSGNGGISVIRLSGPQAVKIADKVVRCRRGGVADMASHSVRFAAFVAAGGAAEEVLDEGVVTLFRAPRSYTGEDVVELACHASPYIVRRLLSALTDAGARMAEPGEFTKRAFLNGKMDLSQAEAVADLIASENKASHDLAWRQLRGGVSDEMAALRARLVEFAALVELELDFSEEDVEFADRQALRALLDEAGARVAALRRTFATGLALKEGVPVVLIGRPNAGKSTLLNALLREERALVSDIPGTTRDTIEEVWECAGVRYRFIDTAGLREGRDEVERMGIRRTVEKMRTARAWLYLFDAAAMTLDEARAEAAAWQRRLEAGASAAVAMPEPRILFVANKVDAAGRAAGRDADTVYLSARERQGIDLLEDALRELLPPMPDGDTVILTNARHYEVLGRLADTLDRVLAGLNANLSGDLLAQDIREALRHIGEITGEVYPDELLRTIFGRFCIGK
ncbi:MAG: tRNA uridine-5-carboxymethylaminomethyl(34) synthesis GTPase MnmE [Bacteroidales bacterium]|nr:tRNA uridine-5-carboxymethylaminomethyl(34) synthesis GTPase MnmE [Bacteroidales bacterium]